MELKELEATIIETLSAAYGRSTVDDLIAQRDADIVRLSKKEELALAAASIRDQVQAMLVISIELSAERFEEEPWRRGLEGAILEGRISILREILDWMSRAP